MSMVETKKSNFLSLKFAEEVEKSVKHFPFQNDDDEESSFEWKEKFNFRNWAKNDFFIPASSAKKVKNDFIFQFSKSYFRHSINSHFCFPIEC